ADGTGTASAGRLAGNLHRERRPGAGGAGRRRASGTRVAAAKTVAGNRGGVLALRLSHGKARTGGQDEIHAGPQVTGEPGSKALGWSADARGVPAPGPVHQQGADARRLGGGEVHPAVADQPAPSQI